MTHSIATKKPSREYQTLRLIPSVSLGNFELETSLESVILSTTPPLTVYYADRVKDDSQNDSDPESANDSQTHHNIIILKHQNQIFLYFEEKWQRLEMIRFDVSNSLNIDDSDRIRIRYMEDELGDTLAEVYALMGPTHRGQYNKETGKYMLAYPGVAFVFDIPSQWSDETMWQQEIPLEFPDRTSPKLMHVYIYKGRKLDLAIDAMLNPKDLDEKQGNLPIHVVLGKGISIGKHKIIRFGDSTQDVLNQLGYPDDIYFKKHDKLKIFSKQSSKVSNNNVSMGIDYFYNYFRLGMDIFFSGATHRVKKIILHTNFCGSYDFNVYSRSNFYIPYKEFYRVNNMEESSSNLLNMNDNVEQNHSNNHLGNPHSNSDFLIDESMDPKKGIHPLTNFNELKQNLKDIPCGDYVASRISGNPFGGTKFYPFKYCIIETLRGKQINSITLFGDY